MKFYIFILVGILLAEATLASDRRLTKEEFLSRVERGTLSLERGPIMAIPEALVEKIQAKMRAKYPKFKPEMWYVNYITDNSYIYSLFFDWTLDQCLLRIEKIDPRLGKPNEKTMDVNGQVVKKMYCDKAYGKSF